MKTIYIKAGLGNQLFQYAYGRSLELSGKHIQFNISFFYNTVYCGDTIREFGLDKFNIQTNAAFVQHTSFLHPLCIKALRFFGYSIDEYFQEDAFATSIEPQLRRELTLKESLSKAAEEVAQRIQNNSAVSVHIRRGDYVTDSRTHAYHGICDISYYLRAMERIEQDIQNPYYVIFSDDIEWAKEHLNAPGVLFVSGLGFPDYEELVLMSKCKHHIIANSSFSWWGAWLNQSPDKIVIAPKQWFQNAKAPDSKIVPPSWIRI